MSRSQKRKKGKGFYIFSIVADVVLVLAIAVIVMLNSMLSGLKTVTLDSVSDEQLGISAQVREAEDAKNNVERQTEPGETTVDYGDLFGNDGIFNFMIFGVDSVGYTEVDKNRSDTNIIVSVNAKDKKINLISILRDSKVPIEGHSPQKINSAYAYGGPILALKTINQNFKLALRDYVALDFAGLVTLIDDIGGLDLELTKEEADWINQHLYEFDYTGDGREKDCDPVHEGLNHMNGTQTLLYSRIRAIDTDYYRAGRQQVVLNAIVDKVKKAPKTALPGYIEAFLKNVETTFTMPEILDLVNKGVMDYEITTRTFPDRALDKDVWGGIDDTGSWVWTYDLDKAAEDINKIVSGN